MKTITESDLKNLSRVTPAWFAYIASRTNWRYAEHLYLIDSLLIKSHLRKIKRLIINLPPRHGKSELISKYFPAWYLGINPDHKVLLTSYEARFAASWGRKVRDLISEWGKDIFNIECDPNSKSSHDFRIKDHDGGLSCVGAGGAITGKGAHVLIIDDPIKNDKQAHSLKIRDNIWEWYKSTAFTRLEPDGIIIIIMTRWHEDDLCGRILAEEPHLWTVLKIPAIAEEKDDPLKRNIGEALWSERFPKEKLLEIRKTIGDYWFSSLYQQNPVPKGQSIFNRNNFRYFTEHDAGSEIESNNINIHNEKIYRLITPKILETNDIIILNTHCSVFATVDLAIKSGERNDYTVIIIFAVTPDRQILILDIIRKRFEASEHIKLIGSIYERYNPKIIGIESVQYQVSLIQQASKLGYPTKELKADRDKLSRALPMAARIESGTVYFRKDASYLRDFEEELLSFPNGRFDDQVDAFSYISQIIEPITTVSVSASSDLKRIRGIARDF